MLVINEFLKLEKEAKRYKGQYPNGARLELISMEDPQAVPPGTRGTVQFVDDVGSIHMNWDNGRTLALVPKEDSFRKLTEQEIEQEQNAMCVEETTDELADEQSDGPVMSMWGDKSKYKADALWLSNILICFPELVALDLHLTESADLSALAFAR